MPDYTKKEAFEVYNVIGVKDALGIIEEYLSNSNFNTQNAEDFFIEKGVTVYGLVAPAHRLSDKINEKEVEPIARKMAKADRQGGRS